MSSVTLVYTIQSKFFNKIYKVTSPKSQDFPRTNGMANEKQLTLIDNLIWKLHLFNCTEYTQLLHVVHFTVSDYLAVISWFFI